MKVSQIINKLHFVLTSPPLMLCVYLQTFESALFLEEEEHQIKLMTLWKSQRRSTPDCLINISHRILTIKEEALRYGLKHHILPRSVNDISVKTAIEKQIYDIKKDITLLPNSLIEAIKHSTLNFLNAAKQL